MDNDAPPIGTIMLIDDEQVDQMLYGRIVERSKHAERIVTFLEPEKALDHLTSDAHPLPDLILLDINMPRMDGFEFLELLVEKLGNNALPAIYVLSTSFDPDDRARAEACDLVQGFVQKPLTAGKLSDIRQVLGGHRPATV